MLYNLAYYIKFPKKSPLRVKKSDFIKRANREVSKYFKQKNWLEENEVLFSYSDWFMTDKDIQASGKVSPSGRCYDWVSESLAKQSDW